jgi:photosystem II stability/assembly factor-like uncharacterized protein
MKLILNLLIFTFIFAGNGYSQWIQQSVPGDIFILTCINFENANSGIATGWQMGSNTNYARCLRTTNGGLNWLPVATADSFRVIAQFEYTGSQTAIGSGAYNLPGSFSKNFSVRDLKSFKNLNQKITAIEGSNPTRGAFFKTTNGGANWNVFGELPSQYSYATYMDFINPANGVVLASLPQNGTEPLLFNIIKTTNGGNSWTSMLQQTIAGDFSSIAYVNENVIFASGESSPLSDTSKGLLLKTTNGGTNWTIKANDTLLYGKLAFINENTGFVNALNKSNPNFPLQQILKTTDCGETWRTVLTEDSLFIGGLKFYGETGVGFMYATNTGFDTYECYSYRTSNFGETWSKQIIINSDPILITGCMLDKYNYYTAGGGFNGKIFHTTNGGSVSVNNVTSTQIKDYNLSQNYPNPFNPSTNINYSLSSRSSVVIKVFDITGKEVRELVNGVKPEGIYEVSFNAENLSGGVYYYRLTSGDFSETRKMILIK